MDTTNTTPEEVLQAPDQDTLISKLKAEKKAALEYQRRKHNDWTENYELYRNKVRTNRLTQRQSVNIPLMKETVKTALANIDDAPSVEWKEKSGDEMKELVYQEIWNQQYKDDKLELKDVQDKKSVLIYGISTKKLNVKKDGVTVSVLDPYDVVYDPLMNPLNIESARYIIHLNIFKTVREILASDRYTQAGKDALMEWSNTQQAIIASNENKEQFQKKIARLKAMGVTSDYFGTFAGGDVLVNIAEHFTEVWNKESKKFERRVVACAQELIDLSNDTLKDAIGIEEWPFEMWTEDIETIDIYPDSVADLVRVPNKIVNAWFSQLVENRTLRNFNMHWYDATVSGYQPQTYEPSQGRMLPAPGDPNKTIMPVAIDGLDDTMEAINFLTNIVGRGSGVTAIDKGTPEGGQQTLGEVQILVGKSQERAVSMKTFYRNSCYATAVKWDKLMQANNFSSFNLYKTGVSGKVYEKTVAPKDWKSEAGYEPIVSSTSEQEENGVKAVQKWLFVKSQFPNNVALNKIAMKRELELLDITPQELQEVQDEEERMVKAQAQAALNPAPAEASGAPAIDPNNPDLAAISNMMNAQ